MDFSSSGRNIIFLFILVILATVLLWFIYDGYLLSNGMLKIKSLTTVSDPRELVAPLPTDSSAGDYRTRFLAIEKNAVIASEISIGNECMTHPPIFRMDKNSKGVMIKNDSDRDRVLTFDGELKLDLASGEEGMVDRSVFRRGAGVYGYLCDQGREPSGLIYVE